jgi:hypothetical protein
MNHINLQTSLSFADLLDRAFRFSRAHCFTLWSSVVRIFALTFSLTVCLTLLFGTLWPLALLVFVNLVIGLNVLVALTAQLSTDQAIPRSTRWRDQFRRYVSVLGAYGLQLIILLLPIAFLIGCIFLLDFLYRNEPPPMGSADTASEQMFYHISLLFMVIYPCFVAYIVSSFWLAIPAIVLEHVGALDGLKRSWHLVQPSLRKQFLALLLIFILHTITQVPSFLLLWQWPIIAGDSTHGLKLLLLAVTVQSGLTVCLPIQAAITTVIYWYYCNHTFL